MTVARHSRVALPASALVGTTAIVVAGHLELEEVRMTARLCGLWLLSLLLGFAVEFLTPRILALLPAQ
jgi:hypothetical protein